MEKYILCKKLEIDNHTINLYRTIPLYPEEMYNFMLRYLPLGITTINNNTIKRINPDFKHMIDYINSLNKKMKDDINYVLVLLYLPPCPEGNILGNFFGYQLNNINKDFNIFPFGNAVLSNISLVSKRNSNHSTYILLSVKGNKNLKEAHHSYSYTEGNQNISVGYFLAEKWANNVIKRYINYLYSNNIKTCIDNRYLTKFLNNNNNNNNNITILKKNEETHNQNNENKEKQNNENETNQNETNQNEVNQNETNQNEVNYNLVKENDNASVSYAQLVSKTPSLIQNPNTNPNTNHNTNQNITLSINSNTDLNTYQNQNQNIDQSVAKIQIPLYLPLTFNYTYYKYQEEIINLKKLIYYLVKNKGIILDDISNEFSNDLLKSVFGNDYEKFLIKQS